MWSNFKLEDYDYLFIVDLEATCSNDGSVPRHRMETIEIGAVIADARTFESVDEISIFVKPILHPKLTDFCTELTSITQHDVDYHGIGYPLAIQVFREFMDDHTGNGVFCSWGAFDKNLFHKDCILHNIEYPFNNEHVNLKTALSLKQGRKKQYGMMRALRLCGIELEGTHHRGIDDARNMVKLLPFIFGDKKV
jgi:inhibitor of KinA sporulation pathway (predicted exonuclease)